MFAIILCQIVTLPCGTVVSTDITPINMLFNICLTFVGLVFLPVLLIISFALPFYMRFVRELSSEVCSIPLCMCP